MKKLLLSLTLTAICFTSYARQSGPGHQYEGSIELGHSFGAGELAVNRVSLETVHGIKFSGHFYAGIGFGVHYYYQDYADDCVVPLFINGKAVLFPDKLSPYFSLDVGYGIGTGEVQGMGGMYISPAVGLSVPLPQGNELRFGLAFQSQKITESGYSLNFNAVALRLGISF